MEWLYEGKRMSSIEDFPEGVIGFIYLLLNDKGQKYIGQKSLIHKDSRKLSQKAKAELKNQGINPRKRRFKESDWKAYHGSVKIKPNPFNENNTKRTILELCYSKTQLTYAEVKWMFKLDVLCDEDYLNGNILGKFYKKTIKDCAC